MKEIFYKTFFGRDTVVISVLRKEDESISIAIAKYQDTSKTRLESHQQFGLRKEDFKELVTKLSDTINNN